MYEKNKTQKIAHKTTKLYTDKLYKSKMAHLAKDTKADKKDSVNEIDNIPNSETD